jgi:beta-glucosidase
MQLASLFFVRVVGLLTVVCPVTVRAQTNTNSLERARAVVTRMSLSEKVSQMHGHQDDAHLREVVGIPRLGIPPLTITNGPAGVGPGWAAAQPRATALPSPVALAATWDTELADTYGHLSGEEARFLGSDLLESPDINIVRIPQSGRAFETYGEDTYLTGRLAVATIRGIQDVGVLANVKHYAANNQETDRGSINEIIDERALREIYLPAFEASIKEGHVASVMCAYPKVNGAFDCENDFLVHTVLKSDWGFDGFVTSDFGAVHSTLPSLLAGLDLELPSGRYFGDALKAAIQEGKVDVRAIDSALVRRFSTMMQLGLWDRKEVSAEISAFKDGAIARTISEQSIVLLKNSDGLLPLDAAKIKSVALIGPYAAHAVTGGGGSSKVIPFYAINPVDGVAAHLRSQTPLTLVDGTNLSTAVAAAKESDIAIVMVGDEEGEDHDHDIALPDAQDSLIAAVAAANPRTVVVLKTGSAVLMPWIDKIPAVLEAWYPGEEDGNAVANVLFGDVNPSGHLPVSFPRTVADTLAHSPNQYPGDHHTVHYSEGLDVGYRWFQQNHTEPLFPFGYGLSYTSFRLSDLKVQQRPGELTLVSCELTNVGNRDGAQVAQLYIGFPPIAEGDEPPLQLKGFTKVMLKAGGSRTLSWQLPMRAFSYWSVAHHQWQVAQGSFDIHVGFSSENLPLQQSISLK